MTTLGQPWNATGKAALIFEALKNKYRDVPNDHLQTLIEAHVAGRFPSDGPDPAAYAPAAQDVASQVRALRGIESGASADTPTPVRWLHSLLLDRDPTEDDFRQESFVDDFGGEPPVAVKDIHAALHELELLCRWSVPAARLTPFAGQAALLAHIYSSVIRIHPFRDANGRTARLLVQYALHDWGMGILPIPKVRNDQAWHRALGCAIAGRIDSLAEEFLKRLARSSP